MIEKIIKDYLQDSLGLPVRMEEEDNLGTLAIQSYSTSMYKAAALNERVKEAMEKSIELDDISRCELNSDYNYSDTGRKKYRYQAVFDIVYY